MGRTTKRSTMDSVVKGEGPQGGEKIVQQNIFLTDAFGRPLYKSGGFTELEGPPNQIDGFANDDQYRRSARLLQNNQIQSSRINTDMLRENSLARQLETKDDQPAIIRLIRRKKSEELSQEARTYPNEPLVPWENLIPPNTKFFLEQVQENREEKVQVVDTFGQWVAFFFGQKPEVYTYSGTLLNSKNHNWKNEFQQNYDYFLRGSQAVKNRATVFLQYDDVIVEGYILNISMQITAVSNHSVPFSFSVLVINRSSTDPVALLQARIERGGASVAQGELLNSLQTQLDISDRSADDLSTFLIVREQFSGNYVPLAGSVAIRDETNNIESDAQTKPGEAGGLSNPKPASKPFSPKATDNLESSLGSSAVTLEEIAGGIL